MKMVNIKEQTNCEWEDIHVVMFTMIPEHREDIAILTIWDKPSLNFKKAYNSRKSQN